MVKEVMREVTFFNVLIPRVMAAAPLSTYAKSRNNGANGNASLLLSYCAGHQTLASKQFYQRNSDDFISLLLIACI